MTSRNITRLLVALVAAFGLIAGSVTLAGAQSNERAEEAQSNGTDGDPPCDAGEAGDNNPNCTDGEFQPGSQDGDVQVDEDDNGADNDNENGEENNETETQTEAQAHSGTDGNPPCDAGRAGEMNPNCVDGEFQRGPQDGEEGSVEVSDEENGDEEPEENGDEENGTDNDEDEDEDEEEED